MTDLCYVELTLIQTKLDLLLNTVSLLIKYWPQNFLVGNIMPLDNFLDYPTEREENLLEASNDDDILESTEGMMDEIGLSTFPSFNF